MIRLIALAALLARGGCTIDGELYETMDLCKRSCPGKCHSVAPEEWGSQQDKGYVCVIEEG